MGVIKLTKFNIKDSSAEKIAKNFVKDTSKLNKKFFAKFLEKVVKHPCSSLKEVEELMLKTSINWKKESEPWMFGSNLQSFVHVDKEKFKKCLSD